MSGKETGSLSPAFFAHQNCTEKKGIACTVWPKKVTTTTERVPASNVFRWEKERRRGGGREPNVSAYTLYSGGELQIQKTWCKEPPIAESRHSTHGLQSDANQAPEKKVGTLYLATFRLGKEKQSTPSGICQANVIARRKSKLNAGGCFLLLRLVPKKRRYEFGLDSRWGVGKTSVFSTAQVSIICRRKEKDQLNRGRSRCTGRNDYFTLVPLWGKARGGRGGRPGEPHTSDLE